MSLSKDYSDIERIEYPITNKNNKPQLTISSEVAFHFSFILKNFLFISIFPVIAYNKYRTKNEQVKNIIRTFIKSNGVH